MDIIVEVTLFVFYLFIFTLILMSAPDVYQQQQCFKIVFWFLNVRYILFEAHECFIESGIGDHLSNSTNWIHAMISLRFMCVITLRLYFVFDGRGDYCEWDRFANGNYNTRRDDDHTISNKLYSCLCPSNQNNHTDDLSSTIHGSVDAGENVGRLLNDNHDFLVLCDQPSINNTENSTKISHHTSNRTHSTMANNSKQNPTNINTGNYNFNTNCSKNDINQNTNHKTTTAHNGDESMTTTSNENTNVNNYGETSFVRRNTQVFGRQSETMRNSNQSSRYSSHEMIQTEPDLAQSLRIAMGDVVRKRQQPNGKGGQNILSKSVSREGSPRTEMMQHAKNCNGTKSAGIVFGSGGDDGTSNVNNNRQFLSSTILLPLVLEHNILPDFVDLDDSGIIYKSNSEQMKQAEHKQLSLNSNASTLNPAPNAQSTLRSDLVSTRRRMSQISRQKAKQDITGRTIDHANDTIFDAPHSHIKMDGGDLTNDNDLDGNNNDELINETKHQNSKMYLTSDFSGESRYQLVDSGIDCTIFANGMTSDVNDNTTENKTCNGSLKHRRETSEKQRKTRKVVKFDAEDIGVRKITIQKLI